MDEIGLEELIEIIITDKGGTPQQYYDMMDYIAFHETGAQTPDELPTETLCAVSADQEGGCSQSTSAETSTMAVVGLFAALLAAPRLRRRR